VTLDAKQYPGEYLRLEQATLAAWPSFEAIDYDGWILRFADGYTKRANSVNPHFGSSLPLSTKIAHCEAFYEERELPTIFRLTPFSRPANLDEVLAERGYEMLDPSLVMTCRLDNAQNVETDASFHVSESEWFCAFDRLRKLEAVQRASHRRIIEASEGDRVFAVASVGGEPCACGLGVQVGDAIGLFDLLTRESHRGQGFGSSIVRSILEWASAREARMGFLQVHSENAPARRLYERFGFEVAYAYWYRVKT
jgi:GNAT superfamily N-acetyltransferase